MKEKKWGGKRPGAGRKKSNDPISVYAFYVKRSTMLKFGSPDKFRKSVKEFIDSVDLDNQIDYSANTFKSYDSEKLSKVIEDEPPMFQSMPFNQEADFMERIKELKNMNDLKKIVQEVEKSDLTFFPKKRVKDFALKISENFYQD